MGQAGLERSGRVTKMARTIRFSASGVPGGVLLTAQDRHVEEKLIGRDLCIDLPLLSVMAETELDGLLINGSRLNK